jgi:hypothetical protein
MDMTINSAGQDEKARHIDFIDTIGQSAGERDDLSARNPMSREKVSAPVTTVPPRMTRSNCGSIQASG